jgi:HAD superfamily hydrolase (TIGR01509 family)
MCAERGLAGPALTSELEPLARAYKAAYARLLSARAGTTEALEKLTTQGRLLGVISNGRPAFQRMKLERCGLMPFFQGPVLVSGDFPAGYAKPSPRLFEEALSRTHTAPRAAAFVGDRTADVIGANLAGLWTIRYLAPEQPPAPAALRCAQPHATVETVAEIPNAVASLEQSPR